MFKNFISLFSHFIVNVFTEFRKITWKFKSGFSKLKIDKEYSYYFAHYGDITRMLYTRQHLVPFDKSFEYETVAKFIEYVKPGFTVFDIGANIGVYSLLSSDLVGDTGKVYAFEPSDKTFETLNKNIIENSKKNIKTEQIALSNETGKVVIGVKANSDKHEYNDAFNHMQLNSDISSEDNVVPMDTFDNYCNSNKINQVDFIKIDIEGAELLFFQGAKETLLNHKPTIIFELVDKYCRRFNTTMVETFIFLDSIGYDIIEVGAEQWLAISKK